VEADGRGFVVADGADEVGDLHVVRPPQWPLFSAASGGCSHSSGRNSSSNSDSGRHWFGSSWRSWSQTLWLFAGTARGLVAALRALDRVVGHLVRAVGEHVEADDGETAAGEPAGGVGAVLDLVEVRRAGRGSDGRFRSSRRSSRAAEPLEERPEAVGGVGAAIECPSATSAATS